ncbi:MAG: hypothetical protein HY835_03700, partial [Anaerolineae bacterium]|nr:hypothetical protein [Anaerolineae bacterium]
MASQTTFVTTLGGKPEIITMQVDMLLARGFPIDQVLVILLSANLRCQEAYQRLQAEFAGNRYQGKPIGLQAIPLRVGDRSLGQVSEPAHVEAVRRTFNELLADLKQKNQTIHLGATAGRRIMALVGLAAAMQYLEPTDHVWHMHTPDEVKVKIAEGGLMHVPTDWGVQLVEVPFVPWAAYFPGLAPLLKRNSSEMLSARFGWLDDDDRRRCAAVWEALTPRQRVVLG